MCAQGIYSLDNECSINTVNTCTCCCSLMYQAHQYDTLLCNIIYCSRQRFSCVNRKGFGCTKLRVIRGSLRILGLLMAPGPFEHIGARQKGTGKTHRDYQGSFEPHVVSYTTFLLFFFSLVAILRRFNKTPMTCSVTAYGNPKPSLLEITSTRAHFWSTKLQINNTNRKNNSKINKQINAATFHVKSINKTKFSLLLLLISVFFHRRVDYNFRVTWTLKYNFT